MYKDRLGRGAATPGALGLEGTPELLLNYTDEPQFLEAYRYTGPAIFVCAPTDIYSYRIAALRSDGVIII